MNSLEKTAFIKQQIKLLELRHVKVNAVRLHPFDRFKIDWNSFSPVLVKFDPEIPIGQFVIETDNPEPAANQAHA